MPNPSNKQEVVVEVSASAKPSEVVAAVLAGSQTRTPLSNPNRWFQLGFVFIMVFGIIICFREELWAVGRDMKKYPIMGHAEQLQIQQYLGTEWLFGSGKDIRAEDAEVAQIMQKVSSNTSIPANKIRLNATLSNGTRPSMMFSSRAALINGTRGAFFNGTRGASRPRHRRPQNGTAATHGNVMRAFTDLNKHQQR